ncbi:MAG: phosphate signaling complex protein PhoU [Bacteroidota bacterium]
MERHFFQELEVLKTTLIRMGSLAEEGVAHAVRSLLQRDAELARQVLEREARINAFEVEVDDLVVDLLALQQPVATDLRFILAASKINGDLERIGDHAVNIAESALLCASLPPISPGVDIAALAETTKRMLKDSIDGFIQRAPETCRAVLRGDDLIDDMHKGVIKGLVEQIRSDPSTLDYALELMRVSRNLERVADLATNIAEDVIFMTEAMVVKHGMGSAGRAS